MRILALLAFVSTSAWAAPLRSGQADVTQNVVQPGIWADSWSDEECDYTAIYFQDLHDGSWHLWWMAAECVELTIDGFEEVEDEQ